jgi:hypothetical protein
MLRPDTDFLDIEKPLRGYLPSILKCDRTAGCRTALGEPQRRAVSTRYEHPPTPHPRRYCRRDRHDTGTLEPGWHVSRATKHTLPAVCLCVRDGISMTALRRPNNIATLWSEHHEPAEWILLAGLATVSLPPVVSHFPSRSYAEILPHLAWADVTVCQSAPGSVFAAIARRATPIVVPRSRSLGEHVDDHQHALANHLATAGIATVVTNAELLEESLCAAISEPREARIERLAQLEAASRKRTMQWSRRVGQEIESLCDVHSCAAPLEGPMRRRIVARSTRLRSILHRRRSW